LVPPTERNSKSKGANVADSSVREAERRWTESGLPEDGARFILARQRAGQLNHAQINTAAFLGDRSAEIALSDGMYDQTGKLNDHIAGICPCGWCRWDEGPIRWYNSLLGWAQNLPFPGIDGPHAEQEMLIRTGRALANAIWDKLYTPGQPNGAFVIADMRAESFLEERTEEARRACRALWDDPAWGRDHPLGAPDWTHQVLYFIVNPSGWRENAHTWFRESAQELRPPCKKCGNRVSQEQLDELSAEELGDVTSLFGPLVDLPINCEACQGVKPEDYGPAREAMRKALVPWVLSSVSYTD